MTTTVARSACTALLAVALVASACGGEDEGGDGDSGGSNEGGTDSGGTNSGGTNSGGTNSGGTNSGGTNSGSSGGGGAQAGGGRGGASGAGTGGSAGSATSGRGGGGCSDTMTDPANCGACGNVCRNQDPVFDGFGCPEGECCVEGVCHPTWGDCITENEGYATCAEYCESIGEACAAGECSTSTWAGFAAGNSCAEFGVAASGRADPCDMPIPWGAAAVNVRCCCTDSE